MAYNYANYAGYPGYQGHQVYAQQLHQGQGYQAPNQQFYQGPGYQAPGQHLQQGQGYQYPAPAQHLQQRQGYQYQAPAQQPQQGQGYKYQAPAQQFHQGQGYQAPAQQLQQRQAMYAPGQQLQQSQGYQAHAQQLHQGQGYQAPAQHLQQGQCYQYQAPAQKLQQGQGYQYQAPAQQFHQGQGYQAPAQQLQQRQGMYKAPGQQPQQGHGYQRQVPSQQLHQGQGYQAPAQQLQQGQGYQCQAPAQQLQQGQGYQNQAPAQQLQHCQGMYAPGQQLQQAQAGQSTAAAEQPVGVEHLKAFVTGVQNVGVKGLLVEFEEIRKETQAIGTTPKTAFDAHPEKNRYKDVFCVDASRVVLKFPDSTDDYIHANWVDVGENRKCICTQGPTPATVNDFWQMVWGEKVGAIIMLCNVVEQGKKKCEQYYPEAVGETVKYGPVTVKVTSKRDAHEVLSISTLQLSVGSEIHEVEHLLWQNWPDRGVPPQLMACFKLIGLARKRNPVVIHCSAGIGRTGTVVALDMIHTAIVGGKATKLKEIVTNLRHERHGCVQTDVQYVYIARCVVEFAIEKKVVDRQAMAKFIGEYETFCKAKGFSTEAKVEEIRPVVASVYLG